jgi:Tol biopolymer transport system component
VAKAVRCVLVILSIAVVAAQPPPSAVLDRANVAWNEGDYISALTGYITLVQGNAPRDIIDAIALQTGELYETSEITDDGLAPRFDPTGRLIAYEVGTGPQRLTRILEATSGFKSIADLTGFGAVFSRAGDKIAYLRPRTAATYARDVQQLESAAGQPGGSAYGQQLTAWFQSTYPDIVIRDLAAGRETVVAAERFLKSTLGFSPDGRTLYFIGARDLESGRNDVYAIADGSVEPVSLTEASRGFKSDLVVDPRGAYLGYVIQSQNPLRRPAPPGTGTQATLSQTFATHDLKTGVSKVIAGVAPTFSADGTAFAYLVRGEIENSVMVGPVGGDALAVKRTTSRVDAPALSADGQRVAFQMMPVRDWEIYVIDRDGRNEKRVTREIQHDVLPRFLGPDRLLASIGEPRHRRSHLYDLNTLARSRVFHNNTVRTIAPEYVWIPSPDGARLLVGAERDGDTVSPARGIYLVSLDRVITKDTLLARLQTSLAAERDLRARGEKMYRPLAESVRRVVADVSAARIFSYEKALFDFDSKHISRPGNRLAGEYLFRTYASFGYEPETGVPAARTLRGGVEYQWFEPRQAAGGRTANVIATLRGTEDPQLVYVVSSHYDSVAAGPGADDDTSGTAALLEAARVLATRPMPATIVFASFTGEEAGLLGSREFVRLARAGGWKVAGALNNDTIGWTNDHRLDNTIRYSNQGIRDLQHAAALQFTRLITYDALYYKSTDAAAFFEAWGDIVGGIGSYPILGSPHYHQATDTLDTVNHELITETAKATVASIMLLASSPSRVSDLAVQKYDGSTAEIRWSPSPEKSVRSYIVAYGPPARPFEHLVTVSEPRATLRSIAPQSVVSVKAVNTKGLEGWDWARVTINRQG